MQGDSFSYGDRLSVPLSTEALSSISHHREIYFVRWVLSFFPGGLQKLGKSAANCVNAEVNLSFSFVRDSRTGKETTEGLMAPDASAWWELKKSVHEMFFQFFSHRLGYYKGYVLISKKEVGTLWLRHMGECLWVHLISLPLWRNLRLCSVRCYISWQPQWDKRLLSYWLEPPLLDCINSPFKLWLPEEVNGFTFY